VASVVLAAGLSQRCELPWRLQSESIFLFASIGFWMGMHRNLALSPIRLRPSPGAL
jgi:hypothetical protein